MEYQSPPENRDQDTRAKSGAQRKWEAPRLVEYGHLAKLTRGSSGTMVEAGGMRVSCL